MATRENQGLQIALIIFLMMTVGLAISTYVYFRQAEEYYGLAKASDDKAKNAKALADSRYYQLQSLKYMIGVPNVTPEGVAILKNGLTPDEGMKEIDALKKDFDNDMEMFDDTVAAENRNYRELPKFLLASLMKRNAELVKALDDTKAQIASKDTVTKQAEGQVTVAMTGMKKAADDVAEQLATFTKQVEESNKSKADIQAIADTNAKETAKVTTEMGKKVADLQAEVAAKSKDVETAAMKLKELTNESFERPHGKVTFVNLRNNTVYINLGSADGLQRQVTFSVYDPGVNTMEIPNAATLKKDEDTRDKPKRKASIEVIDVLDDHLAEARILEDKTTDPILPGDNIFTPAWRPGQKLQFALVGKLDLDGDRISDREKVKNMIIANGGEITCELPENAKQAVGKITVNTRFLVIGDRPDEVNDTNALAAFRDIIKAAEANGVQQVAIKDLVAAMGWKGTDRTVKLGTSGASDLGGEKKAKSKDNGFKPRPAPAAAEAAF